MEATVAIWTQCFVIANLIFFVFWREKSHRQDLADKDSYIEKLMDRLQSKNLYEYKVNQSGITTKAKVRTTLSDEQLAKREEAAHAG